MLFFAKISERYAKYRHVSVTHYSFLIPILFFTLVIGLRYMVGTDYEGYLGIVQGTTSHSFFHSVEPFFQHLILFIEKYELHFSFFFIITAFIQILFFYKFFDSKIIFLLPWAIPMFIMNEIGSLENGVRHFTAVMLFFYSTRFIKNQQLVYYVISILIIYFFHKSVLICLPLYFFARREIIKSVYLQFGLVLFFLLSSTFLRGVLINLSQQLIVVWGYGNYMDFDIKSYTTGFGYIILWMLNFIMIGYYPKLEEVYQKNGFLIYWNIYYLSLLLKPLLDLAGWLSRINWYFNKFNFLILAFLLHYLYQHRNNPIHQFFFIFVLFWVVTIFIYSIMTGANLMSPYYFIWDNYY